MHHNDISWLTARPIAHRGYHDSANGIIENCTQAFERAVKSGFSIELDVQVTADGKAAVFHDYTLDRLTQSTGRVDEMQMADLSMVDFKDGTDHIIELPHLLDLIAGSVPLVIELKTPKTQDGRLESAVASAVKGYDGKVALMSFSPIVVETLIALTDRPRGIVSCDYFTGKDGKNLSDEQRYQLTNMLHAGQSKPDFISYGAADFPAPCADLLKALYGLPVICWTAKSEESHREALKYCDQVTFEGYNPDEMT